MLPALPAVGGIISAGVGAIKGAVSNLFGNKNTDPAARELADRLTGNILRLGTTGAAPGDGTAAAPVEGTFYLHKPTGDIYSSRADGFHIVTDGWARNRKAQWQSVRLGIARTDDVTKLSAAAIPAGGAFLVVAAIAVAFILFKGVRR